MLERIMVIMVSLMILLPSVRSDTNALLGLVFFVAVIIALQISEIKDKLRKKK